MSVASTPRSVLRFFAIQNAARHRHAIMSLRACVLQRWNCEVPESRKISIAKDMISDEPSLRLLYITPEGLRHPKLLESLKVHNNYG